MSVVGKCRYFKGHKDIVINYALGDVAVQRLLESEDLKGLPIFQGLCPPEFRGWYLEKGVTSQFWVDYGHIAYRVEFERETPYLLVRQVLCTYSI